MQMQMKFQEEVKNNNLVWLENWYKTQCNGDWEHAYGIRIETLDNPGWKISVSLENTKWENEILEMKQIENSESDWYAFGIKEKNFIGAGDPAKLDYLIGLFRKFIEEKES